MFRGTIVTTTSSVVAAKEERGAYKKWSGDQMDQAVSAVVGDGKSIWRAAMQYNVPRSTLFDRVSGHVQPGAVSGPPKYLTFTEVAELAKFLSHCGTIGYVRFNLLTPKVNHICQFICHTYFHCKHNSSG